jgi:SOS-response transcriptional repressor LexA
MLKAREASVRRMVQVYEAIVAYVDRYGYAPSYRDIARACGISSTSRVRYWLDKLEAEGLITRRPGKARSISVKVVRDD